MASVVTATLGLGCAVHLEVPAGATIQCASNDDCPAGFRCNVHSERCVPQDNADVEGPQPVGNAMVSPPIATRGTPMAIHFTINEPLSRDPEVTFVNRGAVRVAQFESTVLGTNPEYTYVYVTSATGEEEETASLLDAFLIDLAGNETRTDLGASLVFDFKAPGVINTPTVRPQLRILPREGSPVVDVAALAVGSTAETSFVTDEVVTNAAVRVHGAAIDVSVACAGSGVAFTCAYSLPTEGRPPDGSYELQAVLTDPAGNPNVVPLGLTLEIDTVPPCPPEVGVENAILYEREPWGRHGWQGEHDASFFLSGVAGSVEPSEARTITVIAYAAATAARASELARSLAQADGSFGDPEDPGSPLSLGTIDRPVVFLTAVDQAGNESGSECDGLDAPKAVAVRDIAWTATMRDKRSGSSFENPNDFEVRQLFSPTQLQVQQETSIDGDSLKAAGDGDNVATMGAGTWRAVSLASASSPANQYGALAYDAARGKLVRFGGVSCSSCAGVCATTKERTDGHWREVTTHDPEADQDPASRWHNAMTFDPASGGVLLFGGATNPGRSAVTQDTWLWTGVSWKELCTSAACARNLPSARSGHAMATDPLSRKVFLFGGRSGDGATLLSDLWEWNGSAWRELCTTSPCSDLKPSARDQTAMVFDVARRKLVLMGGYPANDETWTYDGSAWTLHCDGSSCSPNPGARYGHAMAYDGANALVVLFGGKSSASDMRCADGGSSSDGFSDTWIWDGAAWTDLLPNNVGDDNLPYGRYGHQMAYDVSRSRTVMIGGFTPCAGTVCISAFGSEPVYNEVWEWDGAIWRSADTSSWGPTGRVGAAMAYDSNSKLAFMHGGATSGGPLGQFQGAALVDDLWSWDGITWSYVNAAGAPSKRCYHSLGAMGGKLFLYGGADDTTVLNDTYSLSLTPSPVWTVMCTTSCAINPGRWGHQFAMDATGLITFGGFSVAGDLSSSGTSTWRRVAAAWQNACNGGPCTTTPSDAGGYAMASDQSTGRVFVFGGISSYSPSNALWRWSGTNWYNDTPSSGTAPAPRSFAAAAFDAVRQRLLLFGGGIAGPGVFEILSCAGSGYTECGDTWEWDGQSWSLARITDIDGDGEPAMREGHSMVYDGARHEVLLFGGYNSRDQMLDDTWIWDGGGNSKPVHIMKARFAAAGIQHDEDQTITGITVHWQAGGVGFPGRVETVGASLYVWDMDHWQVVATNGGSADVTAALAWTSTLDAPLERLLMGPERTVFLAVTPTAANGTGYGTVVSDYAEIEVRYRRHE